MKTKLVLLLLLQGGSCLASSVSDPEPVYKKRIDKLRYLLSRKRFNIPVSAGAAFITGACTYAYADDDAEMLLKKPLVLASFVASGVAVLVQLLCRLLSITPKKLKKKADALAEEPQPKPAVKPEEQPGQIAELPDKIVEDQHPQELGDEQAAQWAGDMMQELLNGNSCPKPQWKFTQHDMGDAYLKLDTRLDEQFAKVNEFLRVNWNQSAEDGPEACEPRHRLLRQRLQLQEHAIKDCMLELFKIGCIPIEHESSSDDD